MLFEAIVRVLSATIRAYSRKARGAGMLKEAIADQLLSLPITVRRAVLASSENVIPRATSGYRSVPSRGAENSAVGLDAADIDEVAHVMVDGLLRVASSLIGVIVLAIQAVDLEGQLDAAERLDLIDLIGSALLSLDTERAPQSMEQSMTAGLGRSPTSSERVAMTLATKKARQIIAERHISFREMAASDPKGLIENELTEEDFDALATSVHRLTVKLQRTPEMLSGLPPQTRDRLYDLVANNISRAQGRVLTTVLFPMLTVLEERAGVA
jgi:predicted DCC family thiol-disulfide oxidoreductase YuxK